MDPVRLTVSAATPMDVLMVARDARQGDIEEIRANSGKNVLQALRDGLRLSKPCYAIRVGDQAVAMFGVVPAGELGGMRGGSVWLIGTDELLEHPWTFLRESKRWLRRISVDYDYLFNVVDARQLVHQRWLKWLGFKFLKTIPEHGVERRPFIEFAQLT